MRSYKFTVLTVLVCLMLGITACGSTDRKDNAGDENFVVNTVEFGLDYDRNSDKLKVKFDKIPANNIFYAVLRLTEPVNSTSAEMDYYLKVGKEKKYIGRASVSVKPQDKIIPYQVLIKDKGKYEFVFIINNEKILLKQNVEII